jgi:hypothetical protein
MAKQKGTKHHVVIKLEDLNKMFKGNDVIPVPKGFVKSIEYLLSAHNVSLAEVEKDASSHPLTENESESKAEQVTEPAISFQTTDFNE